LVVAVSNSINLATSQTLANKKQVLAINSSNEPNNGSVGESFHLVDGNPASFLVSASQSANV